MMKRSLILALVLSLMSAGAVYLTGCGGGSSDDDLHTDNEVLESVAVTNQTEAGLIITTSTHDNLVEFIRYSTISHITFAFDGQYDISSGQPWHGISASDDDGSCTLDAVAGRHKTSGPANWFKSRSSIGMCVSGSWLGWPSSLNFAFSGTLTVDGHSYPVIVGQGNDGAHNNWWIGGVGGGWSSDTASLVTPDGRYRICQWDVSFNQFYVQPK
jgi:hypothetical protein